MVKKWSKSGRKVVVLHCRNLCYNILGRKTGRTCGDGIVSAGAFFVVIGDAWLTPPHVFGNAQRGRTGTGRKDILFEVRNDMHIAIVSVTSQRRSDKSEMAKCSSLLRLYIYNPAIELLRLIRGSAWVLCLYTITQHPGTDIGNTDCNHMVSKEILTQ